MGAGSDTFVTVSVLKRDVFSETVTGHMAGDPSTKLTRRNLGPLPAWSRPIARHLAGREARALQAVDGVKGAPALVESNRDGLTRSWLEGTPLHLVAPEGPEWYADAARLLHQIHARGVTHNDLAKPQNWLVLPDGGAGVIDFQIAILHRRRGALFRLGVREDLRHLAKQKQRFAPGHLSDTERGLLAKRSRPSRIWHATFKRGYNFLTRRVLNWSDNEGMGGRADPAVLRDELAAMDGVRAVRIFPCAIPGGTGHYAFIETDRAASEFRRPTLAFVQTVTTLPDADEALALIAENRMDALDTLLAERPGPDLAEVIAGRANLTDRYIR
ncbi:MAG: serine/threonine protein kinase [Pseudomonadota bacterium]